MSEQLNKRNIHALHDTMKNERGRTDKLYERLDAQEKRICQLAAIIGDLHGKIASLHARLAGTGPTAKG